jgi:uncharacterized protein YndB with AHSA1/START domain
MDHEAMLPHPLAEVFGHLSAPLRLAEWLPDVTRVQAGGELSAEIGTEFGLQLCRGGRSLSGTGELIAYEPPWCVAYRLRCGAHLYVLRLTCTANGAGTRVHIHQADSPSALAVDLARLQQALAAAAPPPDGELPDQRDPSRFRPVARAASRTSSAAPCQASTRRHGRPPSPTTSC